MKKKITLIKLGGSIITNKDIPMSLRSHVLSRLVAEIAKVKKELEAKGELLIVGHGQCKIVLLN
jgi:isopentenyl phosphate kinase